MFRKYEDQLMFCLMMLPLVLLVVGLVGSLIVLWRKKRASGQNPGKGRDSKAPALAIRLDDRARPAGVGDAVGALHGAYRERAAHSRQPARAVAARRFYVYQRLDERGIRIKSITPEGDGLVIRLDSPEQQLLAREALQTILPPGYHIALSESPCRRIGYANLRVPHSTWDNPLHMKGFPFIAIIFIFIRID